MQHLAKFVNDWKIIDRSLAAVFVFYAHVLSADVDRMASQFHSLSTEVKELNVQMVKVVERTAVQKEDIADHKRRIEKNRDSIEDLMRTKPIGG